MAFFNHRANKERQQKKLNSQTDSGQYKNVADIVNDPLNTHTTQELEKYHRTSRIHRGTYDESITRCVAAKAADLDKERQGGVWYIARALTASKTGRAVLLSSCLGNVGHVPKNAPNDFWLLFKIIHIVFIYIIC